MHIETLKIFCQLVQLRSFSKTAEKNLLSQSAISQQLAQLELTHNCQLVNRKKRPIDLTKEGRLLYRAARDICDRYEQLRNDLNVLKSAAGRRINVAAIFSIGMHTLPGYLKKFMVRYPNTNVHIEYLAASRIYEAALAGDIDIGLVAVPKRDKRLQVYDFQNELLVLVCSPNHPLAGHEQIDIHQVQFERFVGFDPDVPTRLWIDGILSRYNISIQPIMEFDNIETVKRAVEINSGVSILPVTAIGQELSTGTVKAVPFSNENFVRPTGIIMRKGILLSEAGRYMVELLRKKS